MKTQGFSPIALFISASLAAAAVAFGQAPIPPADVTAEQPRLPKELAPPKSSHPASDVATEEDEDVVNAGREQTHATVAPQVGSTLSPPVTITYNGSSNAVTITDSGSKRGLSATLSSSSNGSSAVYGETNGGGNGVKGLNFGHTGSGGAFAISNSSNPSAALTATTGGTGSAMTATVTKGNSNQPAILGTNAVSANTGIGVEGTANDIGIYGLGTGTGGVGYGVYGYAVSGGAGTAGISASGIGVIGESASSYGVFGESSGSIGVYGYSVNSNGVYALSYKSDAVNAYSTYGRGMTVHSVNALGIYSSSDNSYGIWGQSANQFGVIGEDSAGGVGVYGSSSSGYAGYFAGKVAATSYLTISDLNVKTDFVPIDGSTVLERIDQMPIASWAFKEDRKLRHIGPTAQDFHAAFGLNGEDDKHINLADAYGVSLAAIQELNKRLKEKDARIAMLERQLKSLNETVSARLAKLEEHASPSPRVITVNMPTATRLGTAN